MPAALRAYWAKRRRPKRRHAKRHRRARPRQQAAPMIYIVES